MAEATSKLLTGESGSPMDNCQKPPTKFSRARFIEKTSLGALGPVAGIQPNYKLEDLDSDGKIEVIVWGGLWDYEIGAEAELDPHRYVVAVYKLLSGGYALWEVFTTRTKYDPYFLRTEKGLPG